MLLFIDRKGGSILVAGYKMLYILSFSAQIFEVTVYLYPRLFYQFLSRNVKTFVSKTNFRINIKNL